MTEGWLKVTHHRIIPGTHDEADTERLPVDVGGVEQGDHVLLDVLVRGPRVEVEKTASSNVSIVIDLETDGLHGGLVQVFLEGCQQLQKSLRT